ncbi:13532_t:CDS:2 [Cetraspora pellucida]|uniref:13532_t:CDS:1 n=1 Tax=Cetraspora pellucida TaxID=1433469 RepID=A0A9N9AXQ0_9GLOM|nr:13532_t:CDS:2 [Cetraspora pellucida]
MPKKSQCKNIGSCAIYSNDDLREKFCKLTSNLLLKAMQSPIAPNLKYSSDDNTLLKHSEKIIVEQSEIENGIYRDIIRLKLGSDGYNVGYKQNHIMMSFCLLNEGN